MAGRTHDLVLHARVADYDPAWCDLLYERRTVGLLRAVALFRDRLVGRIEPRIDRDDAHVRVIGLRWEDGFTPGRIEGFVDAMRVALRAYLRFAGADRLEWAPHPR